MPSLLRTTARASGVLGGLAWAVRWPLAGGGDSAAGDTASWLGSVLLAVSLAAYGAVLVKVAWLRGVVGLALPVLVWSVLEVLRGDGDGLVVDAVVGLAVLLVSAAGPLRSRRAGTGAHTR